MNGEDSVSGLRLSTSPEERVSSLDELVKKLKPQISTALNVGDIEISPLVEKYIIPTDLVKEIHENPPQGMLEKLDYMKKAGIIPLKTKDNGKGMVFGINYEQAPSELKDPIEIAYKFEQDILPFLAPRGIDKENVDFLLLSKSEFQELSELVGDRKKREQKLSIIGSDQGARETYYSMLNAAINMGSSDIHIEPLGENKNRVRFRIDGVLSERLTMADKERLPIVQVIKADAKLLLEERRAPQDGVIAFTKHTDLNQSDYQRAGKDEKTRIDEEEKRFKEYGRFAGYNLRVSTIPTVHGEKAVMRILKSGGRIVSLEELGFPKQECDSLRDLINAPSGFIIFTGPTGSGKTTSLYSILRELNNDSDNIVTIEEPVEMDIPGLNQTQVNRSKDYDFGTALPRFLRQDPDIILIGEMRNEETAKAAVEAAKTGHLVFSTLHTRDSFETLLRLQDLGLSNLDIASCLTGVVSQRLVRKLCDKCKEEYDAKDELNGLFKEELIKNPITMYRKGSRKEECRNCNNIGYIGRTVVPELWPIEDEERNMIETGIKIRGEYYNKAMEKGMHDLVYNGMQLVLAGTTSLEGLLRDAISQREFFKRGEYIAGIVTAGRK